MNWKLINAPKTYRATRKLAERFAMMQPAPHDRPLSERRLAVYEKLMHRGEFRPVTWASAYCPETEETYRANGKHTSVLLTRIDPMPSLYVTLEEYECASLEDVARLYATFDSKMQSRTANDIYRSFASCVPELSGLPHRVISLTAGGIAYAEHQDAYGRFSPAERAEALLEHHDFPVWFHGVVPSSAEKSRHLYRLAVFAAAFATYQKDKDAATTFWTAVSEESDPRADMPTRKLSRWLLTHFSSKGGNHTNAVAGRYRVSDREVFVKCLHAWNAWRKSESTNLQYYAEADVPALK